MRRGSYENSRSWHHDGGDHTLRDDEHYVDDDEMNERAYFILLMFVIWCVGVLIASGIFILGVISLVKMLS